MPVGEGVHAAEIHMGMVDGLQLIVQRLGLGQRLVGLGIFGAVGACELRQTAQLRPQGVAVQMCAEIQIFPSAPGWAGSCAWGAVPST